MQFPPGSAGSGRLAVSPNSGKLFDFPPKSKSVQHGECYC